MNQQDLPTPKAPPLNDERDSFIAKMFAKAKNLLWPPAPQIALPGGEPFPKNPESGMFLRQMSDIESMPDVEYSTPIHSPNDAGIPSAESEPEKPSGIFDSIWSMGESAMQTEGFKKLQKAARTAGLSYALMNAGSDSINQSIQMSTLPGAIVANEKTREERDAEWWARVRRREYETPVPADVEQNRHFDEGGEVAKPSHVRASGGEATQSEAFKKWFGDWENDSENASQIVDKEGSPKRVYHGTRTPGFDQFDPAKLGMRTGANSARKAFFFSDSPEVAESYAKDDPQGSAPLSNSIADQVERLQQEVYFWESEAVNVGEVYEEEDDGGDDWWTFKIPLVDQWGVTYYDESPDLYESRKEADDAMYDYAKQEAEKAERKLKKAEAEYEEEEKKLALGGGIVPAYLSMKDPHVHDFKGGSYHEKSFSELIDEAIEFERDGIWMKNVRDANAPGGGEPSNVYAVFEPTQIKSAIANEGAYDPADPRIHKDDGGVIPATNSPVPIPSMEPGKSTEPKRSPWLHDRLADMVSPITESSLFKKAAKLYKHYSTAAAFVAAMSGGVPDAIKDSMAEGPSQPRDPITREQKLAEKYEKAFRRKEPHKPKPANFGEADHYDIGGVIKKATKAYHHLTTAAAIATAASGGVPDAIGESMGTAPPNPPITRETRVAEEFEQARRRRAPVRPKPVDKGEPKHLADGGPVSEQGDFHFERTGEGQGVFADASPEELEAAHLYQNTPVYGQMQGYLRGTSDNAGWLSKMWHSLTTPKQAKQAISGMDSLMGKSSLPEMTVHRAMVIPEAGEGNRDIEKLPGKTITEPGFASTSVDPASIENFMVRSDRVRGEIHVPSGAQGVSLHPDDTGIKTKWAQEKEILLPRGSSFKVDEVDRDPDQRWRVKMDLLPKDEPSEPRRDGQEALADVQHAADGGKIAGTREILAERGEVVVKPSEAKKPENRAVLEAMNADRGGVPRAGAMSADVPTIPGAPADKTDGGEIHQHLGTPGKDNEPVKVAEEAFVVNAGAAQKPENKEILQSINAGTVPHFDGGGEVNASAETPKSPVENAVATWRALYDRVTDPKLTYPEIDATIAEPFQELTVAQLKEVGAGIGKTIMPGSKAKMVAQFVRMVKDQKENWERLQPRTPHMDEGGEVAKPSQPQASGDTQNEAFKDWFGDSKVTDENGAAKEVYHGTKLNQALAAIGYDGIKHEGGKVLGDNERSHQVYVAFEPTQIKSTSNEGTYDPADPADPRVHKDEGGEVPGAAQPGAFVVRKEQASKFKPILHAIENNQLAADAPQHLDRGGEVEAKPHTAPSRDGRAFPVPPGAEPAAQSSLPSEPDRHGWFDLPEAEKDLFSLPSDSAVKPSEPSKPKPETAVVEAPSEPVRMGIPAMPADPSLTERQQESHDKEAYYRATGDDFLADFYRKANEFDASQAAKSVSGPEPAVSGPAVSGPPEPVRHAIPAPPVDPLLSPARQANRDKIDFHGTRGNTSEADFYKRIDKLDAERESRPVPMAIPASPVNPSMPRERQKVRDEIEYHEKTGNPRKANERRSLDCLMEEASKPRKPAAPVTAAVAEANAEQLERRAKDTFNQTQREGYEENAARWRAHAEELRAAEAARAAEVSEPNAATADDAGAVPEAIRAEDVPEPSPKKRKDNSRHPILNRAVAAGLERSFPAIYGQQDDESQPHADDREGQDLTPEEIKKQKRESRAPILTRAVAEGLKYLFPSIYDQKDEDAIKPNRSSPQEDQPMMFPRKEEQISLGETSKTSGNSLSDNKELLAAINALVAEIKELRRDLKAETPGIKPDGSFVPGLNMTKSPSQEIPLKARDKDASRVAAVQSARNIWRQTQ